MTLSLTQHRHHQQHKETGSLVAELLRGKATRHGLPIDALYVHIPFCFHKCHYCDFYSITRQTPQRMAEFVDRILREAALWRDAARAGDAPIARPTTIFFGGGTPSLLPIDLMLQLIDGLRKTFDLSSVTEWTIECNPATVNLEYLKSLRSAGIDRLSFGAQSFDKNELATLERHHDPVDVPASIAMAREAGFERLNVDLIYAIPGQTRESWMRSLEHAISLQLDHLSCYGLTYETNTPIAVKQRLGKLVAAEESIELQMMFDCRERLAAAGYEAYEISNFAKPGSECRHNLTYWRGGNYLSLGPSGASHFDGLRFRNRPHLGEWETAIDVGQLPAIDIERLTPSQRRDELAMTLLRLARGIDFVEFAGRTGCDARIEFADRIDRLRKIGLIDVDRFSIHLTKSGLRVADSVAMELVGA